MKWFAVTSIVINLALLGILAMLSNREPMRVAPNVPPNRVVNRTIVETNYVDVLESNLFIAPKFDWTMVESESFEDYMSNLRRLKCPDWLVNEIILSELAAHYDELEAGLAQDREVLYWASYREKHAQEREYDQKKWEMAQEEYEVMKHLTGFYRSDEGTEVIHENQIFFLLFSTMNYETALGLMSEVMFQHERKEALDELRKGFLTPTDIRQLREGYRSMKVAGATMVSSGVFEEFWLRLQLVLGSIMDDVDLPGVELTGYQLRELIRIRSSLLDPIEREFIGTDEPKGRELYEMNQLVEEKIANSLGSQKADEYGRSQNQAFRQIHEFTVEQQLPVETAIAVFDVRQAAIDQVRNLMTDSRYDNATKRDMRQLIQVEIEQTLQETLGPEVYPTYLDSEGVWINRVGGSVPTDDAPVQGGGRR